MDLYVPFDQIGQASPGPFINANPSAGVRGSIINGLVFNALQAELLGIQDEAGLTRDVNNNAQVLQALRSGKLNSFTDIGTADAILVQPLSAFISVFLGTEITFLKGPSDNATTTPTLTVGAGSVHTGSAITHPIVRQDGTAVAAGDLRAGSLIKVKYDGLNSFRVITLTRGEFISNPALITSVIQQIPAVAPVANVFSGAGAGSYTVPAGVYNIDVECIGGGAGGGSGTASGTYSAGGGGGSGGSSRGQLAVTPGQVINYVVGAGGAGAASSNNYGSSGTSTTFGTILTAPAAQVVASSSAGYNVGSGQLGGAVGIGGYLNLKGSAGGDGAPGGSIGGNGGGTAYGTGGRAGIPNGENASAYGAGGGGAYNGGTGTTPGTGGRGADGAIIIRHN